MAMIPAIMIGSSLALIGYWAFSLRLPEAEDVGARRKSLSPTQKMMLAYARWVGRGFLDALGGSWKSGAQKLESSADRLAVLADRPGHVTGVEVVGYSILVPLLTGTFLLLYWSAIAPQYVLPSLILGVPLATALPTLFLYDRKSYRLRRIRNSFPGALDMLTLTVEAGMDFTEGMKLLANRCAGLPAAAARKRPDYFVCKLFSELLSDVQMGVPRSQALKRLEEKTGMPEIGSFSTVLALSDETGGNIAANLRQLAGEMRNTRLMRAEEFIAKAPVKMMFPIAVFLFPIIFIVIFGPIGLSLFETMSNVEL